jgi:A/G-specific adenine glycosylase
VKVDAQTETLLLRQKTETDIWQNMYEFPKIEFENLENMKEFCLINRGVIKMTSSLQKHVLSHQHLHAQFVYCSNSEIFNDEDTVEIPISELGSYPLPRLIDRFLEQNQLIFPDKP